MVAREAVIVTRHFPIRKEMVSRMTFAFHRRTASARHQVTAT